MIKWFFVIGAFFFLAWYFPYSVADGKVTLLEIFVISINFLVIFANGLALLNKSEEEK